MKKQIYKFILCLLIVAFTASLGACALRPRPARTADKKTLLRLGFSGEPDSLNPYAAGNEEAAAVLSLLYDTLFTVDLDTGAVTGSLCQQCVVSNAAAGGQLWRITLRDDALWHDGTPVTASDVEFSLQSAKDFSTLYGYPDCEFLDTTGIAVEDDTHLSMIVWGEQPFVAECLSRVPIVPRSVWNRPESMQYSRAGIPADRSRARQELYAISADASTMIGSGLYVWGGYEDGVCTLKLNENYWNGPADAQVLELRFGLADPAEAFLAGEIDACWDMPLRSWESLGEQGGVRLASGPTEELYLLLINHRAGANSALQNAYVRQALDESTDRAAILAEAFGGGVAEAGLLSPNSQWYYDVSARPSYRSFDSAAAASLLEDAGYVDADGDGVREAEGGKALSFRLLCSDAVPAWENACERLRQACALAGMELVISVLPPEALLSALEAGEYDLCLTSRRTYLDPAYSLGMFYWNGGDNDAFFSDGRGRSVSRGWNESGYADEAVFDSYYEQMMRQQYPDVRSRLVSELGGLLYDTAAAVSLGFSARYQACTTVWSGLRPFRGEGAYFSPMTLRAQIQNMKAGGR